MTQLGRKNENYLFLIFITILFITHIGSRVRNLQLWTAIIFWIIIYKIYSYSLLISKQTRPSLQSKFTLSVEYEFWKIKNTGSGFILLAVSCKNFFLRKRHISTLLFYLWQLKGAFTSSSAYLNLFCQEISFCDKNKFFKTQVLRSLKGLSIFLRRLSFICLNSHEKKLN